MKKIISFVFGLGLIVNALLFVPQIIAIWNAKSAEGVSIITFGGFNLVQLAGILHGYFQRDRSLMVGMLAALVTCGTVTFLAIIYK